MVSQKFSMYDVMQVLIDDSRLLKDKVLSPTICGQCDHLRSVLTTSTACALRSGVQLNRDLSEGLHARQTVPSNKGEFNQSLNFILQNEGIFRLCLPIYCFDWSRICPIEKLGIS